MAKRPRKSAPTEDAPRERPRLYAEHLQLRDVLGQDRAIGRLRAAMRSTRLHHAWIFHGPFGVGKFTTALAFAATLLDPTSAPGLDGEIAPDPESPVQRLVRAGSHPDLHVIVKELAPFSSDEQVRDRKQTTIPIGVVEEFLIEPATRSSVMPGGPFASKVMIVDEAHLLGTEAENSLLKTLEEPPPGTLIFLVTDREADLLPTVRSRCERVAFQRLDERSMKTWLRQRPAEADLSSTSDWLLAFADGSPGAMQRALALGVPAWREALLPRLEALERGPFPVDLAGEAARLIDESAAASIKGRPHASKESANRLCGGEMLRLLADDARTRLRAVASDGDASVWSEAIESITRAQDALDAHVQPAFAFERLAAEWRDALSGRHASV